MVSALTENKLVVGVHLPAKFTDQTMKPLFERCSDWCQLAPNCSTLAHLLIGEGFQFTCRNRTVVSQWLNGQSVLGRCLFDSLPVRSRELGGVSVVVLSCGAFGVSAVCTRGGGGYNVSRGGKGWRLFQRAPLDKFLSNDLKTVAIATPYNEIISRPTNGEGVASDHG